MEAGGVLFYVCKSLVFNFSESKWMCFLLITTDSKLLLSGVNSENSSLRMEC